MNRIESFPNAPISEAIMDIKVQLPTETTPENLALLYEKIRDKYPDKQKLNFFETKIEFKKKKEPDFEHSPAKFQGYIFKSSNEKKLIQARLDGFTFNKLKPYISWNSFISDGRKYWDLYKAIALPLKVIRIALRYINRIEIPFPIRDFSDYILTNPQVAPDLPQTLGHYFMRLVIPYPEINSTAILTQTIDKQTNPNKLPLIFDIDVIIESDYSIDNEKIWEDFEILRNIKNEIFFLSTTNKAKELFR